MQPLHNECKRKFEIHDIGEDAGKLVCHIDVSFGDKYASKEDSNEAAFVDSESNELQIIAVEKVVGNKIDKSAITTVKVPESVG